MKKKKTKMKMKEKKRKKTTGANTFITCRSVTASAPNVPAAAVFSSAIPPSDFY